MNNAAPVLNRAVILSFTKGVCAKCDDPSKKIVEMPENNGGSKYICGHIGRECPYMKVLCEYYPK